MNDRRGGRRRLRAVPAEDTTEGVPTWDEVVRSHGRFVYTVAFRLTGDHHEAQDLTQETFLRVRRGLETYRPISLEGWLSRITTNAFLDEARKRQRRPVEALPDEPERVLAGGDAPDEVLARVTLPEDVQEALAALPPEWRAAIVLCDVVGHSYEEIAAALGVPVGTVRSRIHRGRARLRDALSAGGHRG
jgi:RNA polymerase sigma-70 factor (ECF subfamily)